MPRLSVDGGPSLGWDSRRRGLVHISHTIELSARRVRFTVSIPRRLFGSFAQERFAFHEVSSALVEDMKRARCGTGVVVVRVRLGRSRSSMTFERSSLQDLKKIVADLVACGQDAATQLGLYLHARCCCNFVAELVATTPRRVTPTQRRITSFVPAALIAVRVVLEAEEARQSVRVRARVAQIVQEDDNLRGYLQAAEKHGWNPHHALVVGLVDRAFGQAWVKASLPGLLYTASKDVADLVKNRHPIPTAVRYRDPREVLRKYFYGKAHTRVTDGLRLQKRESPDLFQSLYLDWAERTYLGTPGAAATAFGLPS